MQLPTLTEEQVGKFRWICERFGHDIRLPPADHWKTMSDTDIWIRVVSQVVVVGKSDPAKRLSEAAIREKLKYERLCAMPEAQVAMVLGEVLREIGARYVSDVNPELSPKVLALIKNFAFLKAYKGGPSGFIRYVVALKTSEERWQYVAKSLAYVKNKGARDFLTSGFGLATDRIALDSRVMGVVNRIVPELPAKVPATSYAAVETLLAQDVCKPLGITPAFLDQLLFKNYGSILEGLGSSMGDADLTRVSTESLLLRYRQIQHELKRREVLYE